MYMMLSVPAEVMYTVCVTTDYVYLNVCGNLNKCNSVTSAPECVYFLGVYVSWTLPKFPLQNSRPFSRACASQFGGTKRFQKLRVKKLWLAESPYGDQDT